MNNTQTGIKLGLWVCRGLKLGIPILILTKVCDSDINTSIRMMKRRRRMLMLLMINIIILIMTMFLAGYLIFKKNAVAHASLSVVQIPNGVLPAGQQGKYGGIGKACRNLIVINGLVCSGKSYPETMVFTWSYYVLLPNYRFPADVPLNQFWDINVA